VFIIHGHAELQALRLKDYLNKQHVNVFTLEDLAHNGKTIFEQIEYAQRNSSYAIAILTPDDVGCQKSVINDFLVQKIAPKEKISKFPELLIGRARENVLFELGLFIGALGKENVCYIKVKDMKQIFSDFHGVLYLEFKENIDEAFGKLHDILFQ
jgi:predicted nucleotide-binding protein